VATLSPLEDSEDARMILMAMTQMYSASKCKTYTQVCSVSFN
jgi:hypothetical protein